MSGPAGAGGGVGRAVLRSVSVALLLLVLALGAAVIVVPRLAGAVPLTVLTSSMEPGLPPGTLIVVRPVAPDDIRVGDVVTYQIEPNVPGVITHRVISIAVGADGTRRFVLQGDNNDAPDRAPAIEEQVMGRLWYSVPFLGFLNTSTGGAARAWLVPIGAGSLLAYSVVTIVRGARSGRRAARSRVDEV